MGIPSRLRIVIVDDNRRTRSALIAFFSTLEDTHVVGQADSAAEAIELLHSHTPDVVMMDVCMPGMDGIEATRLLKRRWPRVSVVILTLYPGYQEKAISAGADAVLLKGCSFDSLAAAIRKVGGR